MTYDPRGKASDMVTGKSLNEATPVYGVLPAGSQACEESVEITDEALIPDELCTVTVTIRADMWRKLVGLWGTATKYPLLSPEPPRAPGISLISEALGKACPKCDKGLVFNPLQMDSAPLDHNSIIVCPECGGSGKQSVPGARLKQGRAAAGYALESAENDSICREIAREISMLGGTE